MTKFIAEIGSNHNQCWERTEKLIRSAAANGFWAVKFQLFKADEMYEEGCPTGLIESLKEKELPLGFLPKIRVLCDELDLKFGCSFFFPSAVELLNPLVDFYKFAAYESAWIAGMDDAIKSGKPLHISFGFPTKDHLEKMQAYFKKNKPSDLVVYHTIPMYPADPRKVKLDEIEYINYSDKGYSDHTTSIGVVLKTITNKDRSSVFGPSCCADYIELHYDLDDMRGAESSKYNHVWSESKVKQLREIISDYELTESESYTEDEKERIRNRYRNEITNRRPWK